MLRLLLLILCCLTWQAGAEPWLGIRFAQNCAGCHAPGRINLPPMDRRCTLSCQGCHVNPNGGGLRNFYGKWNENRWLRSFVIEALRPASSFAPVNKQHYRTALSPTADNKKRIRKKGHPLVVAPQQLLVDEKPYARDGLEFKTARDDFQFLQQIPQEDPYRLHDASKIDGGAELRYQYLTKLNKSTKPLSFLMSADVGLRWRPLHRNLHLVYEGRMLGNPHVDELAEQIDKTWTRSLYAMIDNLPFNVYVMYGLYRPLFGGNPMPDHRALPQRLTAEALQGGSAYTLQYQTLSIGTAPNVPYANVHVITGRNLRFTHDENDTTRGVAVNVGLRFVTLGINTTYSFWFTRDKKNTQRSLLHSASFGMQLWRTTAMLEVLRLQRKNPSTKDTGNVITLDMHTQLWRQFYLTTQYSYANVTANIGAGRSQQYRMGLRAFLLAGVDVSFNYEFDINEPNNELDQETHSLSSQVHLYL